MLKHWQSHQEYLRFLHEAKVHFDSSQRKRLASEFASARDKLRLLDLDPVKAHLAPFYSTTGRPALNQPQIIRSLTLMLHLGVTSLTRWLLRSSSDAPLLLCPRLALISILSIACGSRIPLLNGWAEKTFSLHTKI